MPGRAHDFRGTITVSRVELLNNPASLTRVYACVLTLVVSAHQPLSDMAAHGTPALGSRGVCVDVDTPAFIDRLPDDVSAIMVAQAIEDRIAHPHNPEDIESQRRQYLAEKSPAQYAQQLLQHLIDGTNARVND